MNTKKKLLHFMRQSPIHEMFVLQATLHYADSVLLNADKVLANKNAIINPQTMLDVANEVNLTLKPK